MIDCYFLVDVLNEMVELFVPYIIRVFFSQLVYLVLCIVLMNICLRKVGRLR